MNQNPRRKKHFSATFMVGDILVQVAAHWQNKDSPVASEQEIARASETFVCWLNKVNQTNQLWNSPCNP